MLKETIKRALIGAPIGVAISFTITLITWAIFYPDMGLSFESFIRYYISGAIIGSIQAGASIIWTIDEWNMSKQLTIFYAIIVTSFFIAASIGQYFEMNLTNILINLGLFTAIFLIIWAISYRYSKQWIHSINNKL